MFVWRKRVGAGWLAANEVALHEIAGRRLAIVSKPGHWNAIAEVASPNCSELEKIRRRFGGIIEKLPRNWLRKFLRGQKPKPLKIGKRLVIVSSTASKLMKRTLVIPAGACQTKTFRCSIWGRDREFWHWQRHASERSG